MEQNQEIKKYEEEFPEMREHCLGMEIKVIGDIDPINKILQEIKKRRAFIYDTLHEVTESANKTHKKAKALENAAVLPWDGLKDILNKKLSNFYTEEDRKRAEKQKKLDEIARKAEMKRIIELEKQAAKWEEKGNTEKAKERREEAEETFIPVAEIPKMETHIKGESGNLSMIKDIEIEIINEMEVLKAIVNGQLPISCTELKIGKIKSYCKSFGIQNGEIKGFIIRKKFNPRVLK